MARGARRSAGYHGRAWLPERGGTAARAADRDDRRRRPARPRRPARNPVGSGSANRRGENRRHPDRAEPADAGARRGEACPGRGQGATGRVGLSAASAEFGIVRYYVQTEERMTPEEKLKELGIELPEMKGFHPAVELGVLTSNNMLYLSGSTPVSYTHLRAHETVLDLVCRLL